MNFAGFGKGRTRRWWTFRLRFTHLAAAVLRMHPHFRTARVVAACSSAAVPGRRLPRDHRGRRAGMATRQRQGVCRSRAWPKLRRLERRRVWRRDCAEWYPVSPSVSHRPPAKHPNVELRRWGNDPARCGTTDGHVDPRWQSRAACSPHDYCSCCVACGV